MVKLIKYLKGSVGAVVMIILLLVVQAFCDLSLPDYTSKIVNIGIQQAGVEDAVPNVIRKSELDRILLFVNKDDKEEVLDNYIYLDKQSLSESEFNDYEKDYPELKNEPLYKLNNIKSEERESLNKIFGKPIMIVSNLESQENSEQAFIGISMMPKEQFETQFSQMEDKFNDISESMITQAATTYIKSEYKKVGIDTDKIQLNYIFTSGAKMIGIALISMVAAVIVGFISARVAAKIARDLREKVFGKVMEFSNQEMEKFSTASLITRSTNDIQQIQMFIVIFLKVVLYAPILGLGGVYKVFQTDVSMSWIIALAVGVIFVVILSLFTIVMPKFKVVQKYVDKLNLVTREIITGIPVIRAFSTQEHEYKRFESANKDLTKTNLFVNRVMAGMMPIMMLIMNGITVLIVWNGSKAIDAGNMQVGDMMAFMQYAMQIIMAFLMISMISILLPRASVSAGRVDEVLETEVIIKDSNSPKNFIADKKGYVEFKNVSFRYPDGDENVIENVSFIARPGETTAFIGSTGSGKSTLVNLIPRFYDVTEGEILVDGVNVKDVTQYDLREKIGYVPQKGVLFSGTIESNIKYGNDHASISEVEKAAEIAQATEFIESKPEKYESSIAQGGTNVSGGQKQRLSIARAIAKKPEIYIFDDSFSALDYKTDATLRKALKEETGDSTVIIVAQRISTILHAEQIVVLDDGKVVGKGKHKELLDTCEVYREIAESQLSKEELANE